MQLKTYITYDNQSANDNQEGISKISKQLDGDVREFRLKNPKISYYAACKQIIKENSQKYEEYCKKS